MLLPCVHAQLGKARCAGDDALLGLKRCESKLDTARIIQHEHPNGGAANGGNPLNPGTLPGKVLLPNIAARMKQPAYCLSKRIDTGELGPLV
jgi:hypothetical protein